MIALQILDIKAFMNQLLITDTFDHFRVLEAAVTTYSTFLIDGHFKKEYYSSDELEILEPELETYVAWNQVKSFCFSLIKGKKTPLNLKITFQLSVQNVQKLLLQSGISIQPDQVKGLLLNVRYDGSSLTCITGISLNLFTMDKSLEHAWDDMVQKFLKQKGLTFELK